MNIPPFVIVISLIVFGFLVGSTAYFYNKSQVVNSDNKKKITSFNGEVATATAENAPSKVDENTKPAEPRGRLSYPANAYVVQAGETLFAIGNKMGMTWQLIMQANGIVNENIVQAGYSLAIPKINNNTDYYRINLVVNEEKATQLNQQLRKEETSEYFNPIEMAKKSAVPYFGVKADDSFTLLEQDTSKGTAVVEVKKSDYVAIIGLIQPKVVGEKGLWAVVYVEKQDE